MGHHLLVESRQIDIGQSRICPAPWSERQAGQLEIVLDLAEKYVDLNRRTVKQGDALAGLTQINMFFENSTRTQASFELAGKRLGADGRPLQPETNLDRIEALQADFGGLVGRIGRWYFYRNHAPLATAEAVPSLG